MLGMLRIGSRSGYEIRKAAEMSLRGFWSVSPPQIYAELSELEKAGLVTGRDGAQGRRARRLYALTRAGDAALREWLLDPHLGDFEVRDLAEVKLFFADALSVADTQRLVAAMRDRHLTVRDKLVSTVLPASEKTASQRAMHAPGEIAQLHVELHEFLAGWCERLGDRLGEVERLSRDGLT